GTESIQRRLQRIKRIRCLIGISNTITKRTCKSIVRKHYCLPNQYPSRPAPAATPSAPNHIHRLCDASSHEHDVAGTPSSASSYPRGTSLGKLAGFGYLLIGAKT